MRLSGWILCAALGCATAPTPLGEDVLRRRFPDALLDDAALCAKLSRPGQTVFDDRETRLRRKVVVSDLHFGPGDSRDARFRGLEDSFFADDWQRFLAHQHGAGPTDLVIAGDFLELWQVEGALDLLPTRDARLQSGVPAMLAADQEGALAALAPILVAHRAELTALGRFLSQGDHRAIVIPGNHDADLLWPKVQLALARAISPAEPSRLVFVSTAIYRHGGVHVEHGHRFDGANRSMTELPPFAPDARGTCRLLASWGQVFVSRFFNATEQRFPFVDNLYPESATLLWALEDEPDKLAIADAAGRFLDLLVSEQSRGLNLSFLRGALSGMLGMPTGKDGNLSSLPGELGQHLVDKFSSSEHVLEVLWKLVSDPGMARVAKAVSDAARALPDARAALLALSQIDPADLKVLREVLTSDPLETAAAQILDAAPEISVVVLGHTHLPGGATKVVRGRTREGHYANSGCWIPVARVEDLKARGVAWKALDPKDRKAFPLAFPSVVIEYDGRMPKAPRIARGIED